MSTVAQRLEDLKNRNDQIQAMQPQLQEVAQGKSGEPFRQVLQTLQQRNQAKQSGNQAGNQPGVEQSSSPQQSGGNLQQRVMSSFAKITASTFTAMQKGESFENALTNGIKQELGLSMKPTPGGSSKSKKEEQKQAQQIAENAAQDEQQREIEQQQAQMAEKESETSARLEDLADSKPALMDAGDITTAEQDFESAVSSDAQAAVTDQAQAQLEESNTADQAINPNDPNQSATLTDDGVETDSAASSDVSQDASYSTDADYSSDADKSFLDNSPNPGSSPFDEAQDYASSNSDKLVDTIAKNTAANDAEADDAQQTFDANDNEMSQNNSEMLDIKTYEVTGGDMDADMGASSDFTSSGLSSSGAGAATAGEGASAGASAGGSEAVIALAAL